MREILVLKKGRDLEVEGIKCGWVEINTRNSKSLVLLNCPPDSSSYLNEKFEQSFDDMLGTAIAEEKATIFIGDINCNYQKDADHKSIKYILASYGLKQQIKET